MRALEALARQQGIDPASLRVGSGRNAVNPHTGQMEFADGVPEEQIEEITVTARVPGYDPETGISCPVLDPRISSPFDAPRADGPHRGLDLGNPLGSPVFAPEDGVVVSTRSSPSGGNQMRIFSDSGVVNGFAHTRPDVRAGDYVFSGQQIGTSDGSGTGKPHLHVSELKGPGNGGSYVNPTGRIMRACKPRR